MTYSCYCDYDAPEFFSERRVKASRKAFCCEECGRNVPAGEPYEIAKGKWDGFFSTHKTCQHCIALRDWAVISVPCFCWAFGNLHDDVRAMVDEVQHDVPGFIMEWGRRMIRIERAKGLRPVSRAALSKREGAEQ